MSDINLTASGSNDTINGGIFEYVTSVGSGTGTYDPFLAVGDNDGDEAGYNTDATGVLDTDASKTMSLKISDIPIVVRDGVEYFEFRVDLNESNSTPYVSLESFRIYTSSAPAGAAADLSDASTFDLVYDIDQTVDNRLLLDDHSSGSGTDDYAFYIPVSSFTGDPRTTYLTLYVEMGTANDDYAADGGFEEWNTKKASTIEGVKFNDLNSNGVRDAGEDGVAGVTVFIDANENGMLDADERTTVTDSGGNFAFYGISLTAATVWIDEVIPSGSTQTTGTHEEVVINSRTEQTYSVEIGNHYLTPELTITKAVHDVDGVTVDPVVDEAGDEITYTITVENTGEVPLTGIVVTDTLDPSVTYVSGDTGGDSIMGVGEIWTYSASYIATQEDLNSNGGGDGDIDNTATASSDQTGEESASAEAPIAYNPDLTIVKVVTDVDDEGSDAYVDEAGDVVTYEISVTNTGNVDLTHVDVSDSIADSVAYVSGDTGNDSIMGVGETWLYAATYTATQDDLNSNGGGDGDIDNTATADSDQTDEESASAEAPIAYDPDLTIVKVVTDVDDEGPDAHVDAAGDVIEYKITLTNTGSVDLTNVDLQDTLIDTGAMTLSGDDGDDGILGVGEVWTYTGTYTVTQDEVNAGGNFDSDDEGSAFDLLRNVASVTTEQTGEQTDDASVPVDQLPGLTIEKVVTDVDGVTVDPVVDAAGDVITYQITVTNTGNVDLTNVELLDSIITSEMTLSGDSNNDSVLGVDEVWTYTATYTVTQADVNAGGNYDSGSDGLFDVIRNVATVDTDQTGPQSDDASVPFDVIQYCYDGLSHGFWKTHAGEWDLYATSEGFEAIFGIDSSWANASKKGAPLGDVTLMQALGLQGGGQNALAREAVAAILNASEDDLLQHDCANYEGYRFSVDEIIDAVQLVYGQDGKTYNAQLGAQLQSILEAWNTVHEQEEWTAECGYCVTGPQQNLMDMLTA